MVIAIDGYASCGKSTLAKDLAQKLGFRHIDSGSMYRATTYFLLDRQIALEDRPGIIKTLSEIHLDFESADFDARITLNGIALKDELRTTIIDENVSTVAAIPEIRNALVKIQRSLGERTSIVMDGRDIGSVVFPNAELKLFVEARLPVRVERRYQELIKRGISADKLAIEDNLLMRDDIDTERKHSPLIKAPDAVVIDNSNLNRMEQLAMTEALAKCRLDRITSEKFGYADS